MSSALDMSLDDLIKNNKKSSGGNFRGRGRGSGPGPARRFPNRGANRANPYSMGKPIQAPESVWQHDMFSDQVPAHSASSGRAAALETGTKLYISNLDYGVSNEDIKELFSEVGDLKRYSVHYDRSGRSKGTAEVVFSRKADAVAAVKRYHNVQLDGKPMKIEIVGTTIPTPAAMPLVSNGTFGSTPTGVLRSGVLGRGGAIVRPRGGGGGGGGGGRGWGRGGRGGRGKGRSDPVSAVDLDADLDKYHSEAMQEN
ncbi:THO complex subunit 4A-like [Aristolochia californica]|uniref:THO complex subunit 4A-like n=1 Tax=Aristolochia californica TaxID=171875 RepID=UPI0035D74D78